MRTHWDGTKMVKEETVEKPAPKRGNPRPPGLVDPNRANAGHGLTDTMKAQIDIALNQLLAHCDTRYVKADSAVIVTDVPKEADNE